MGISSRYYLVPDNGSLRRAPQRIASELPFGNDGIPEFAGTRQRVAQVVVESEDGRPVRIHDARGLFWEFDADGKIDEDLQYRLHERLNAHEAARRGRRTAVVDLVPEIKRRELDARDGWTLTAEDLDRIAADLWPGIHGPASEVSTVKGIKPRKPKLTYEAKNALEKLATHVMGIQSILGQQSASNSRSTFNLVFYANLNCLFLWR